MYVYIYLKRTNELTRREEKKNELCFAEEEKKKKKCDACQ